MRQMTTRQMARYLIDLGLGRVTPADQAFDTAVCASFVVMGGMGVQKG